MGVKQNKRFLKSIDLPHSYFLPFIVMICTSAITLIYLIFDEYYTSYNELNRQLLSESERIERSFSDVVKHTEFVMKVILMQIKTDYKNIEHVENVMNKYSVNPHLNNVLAWTVFSWFDENGIKKVDSMSGTLVQQTHDNTRFYLSNKKRNDGELQIGDVIFGLTSKRNVLPASISASGTDGQDIGYLTIGFDLFELCENLRQKLKDPDITFALLNKNFEIVTQQNGFSKRGNIINESSIKKLVKNKNISFQTLKSFSQSNLLLDNNGVYMQKLQNYPFAIYLQYNNHRFIKSLRKDVVYRSFEVFIFTVVSFFIIVFIYKREKKLRDKAENSKDVAVKALQSKTDFLAYTAHELRSPLSFIVSSSEMMSNKLFGPVSIKYLDYIKSINQSGRELLVFIDDLLENMKLEKKNFNVKEEDVDIKDVLSRSIKVNNVNYNDKILVETHFKQNLPIVISDSKRLFQIFNNIISNAMKYSPDSSSLKVDIKMYKGEMFIHFHDTGYGMSEEGLEKSMHEYEVAHDKNDINVKSIGLGLPLIRNLLELMGIRFFIDSKLGRGTKITIVIPKNKIKSKRK